MHILLFPFVKNKKKSVYLSTLVHIGLLRTFCRMCFTRSGQCPIRYIYYYEKESTLNAILKILHSLIIYMNALLQYIFYTPFFFFFLSYWIFFPLFSFYSHSCYYCIVDVYIYINAYVLSEGFKV